MQPMGAGSRRPASPAERAWRRLLGLADALDDAAALGRWSPRLVPATWASLKLATMALTSPALGAWVGYRSTVNHRRVKELSSVFPEILEAILDDTDHGFPVARVHRADAARRWVLASDLHRAPAGHLDWPARQCSRALYDQALDHYAAGGWGLIENGDIEDYWLVGGSAYGAVYDLARMVAALLPGRAGAALRHEIRAEHFRRIVANYAETYGRIRTGYHQVGRFIRVTGNHDDVYEEPRAAGLLHEEFPGLPVVDFVVLEDEGHPVGLVFHGHQTDGWNGSAVSNRVARFTTSLGSALHDQPLPGLAPGLPTAGDTLHLVEGRLRNRLTRVNGITGATIGLDSLDEVLLFEAARRRWGSGAGDLDGGPWVVLGHTHIPLAAPEHPRDGGRWRRYVNIGSGITYELVSLVEWDGERDPRNPAVRLVGWVPDGDTGARRFVVEGGGSTLRVR